mmetsp:Transcript_12393/g.30929  ORF Transcript_12393/g.30929 Transcript_12393/m.30929 type:complete len:233 (+) Transcript_12393:380-1078(+)
MQSVLSTSALPRLSPLASIKRCSGWWTQMSCKRRLNNAEKAGLPAPMAVPSASSLSEAASLGSTSLGAVVPGAVDGSVAGVACASPAGEAPFATIPMPPQPDSTATGYGAPTAALRGASQSSSSSQSPEAIAAAKAPASLLPTCAQAASSAATGVTSGSGSAHGIHSSSLSSSATAWEKATAIRRPTSCHATGLTSGISEQVSSSCLRERAAIGRMRAIAATQAYREQAMGK